MDTEKLLDTTLKEINEIISNKQRHYLQFVIKKHSGGHRIIKAPSPQLKKIQRAILNVLLYRAKSHPIAHGFTPFKSPKTNAKIHEKAKLVLTVDIQDFFPSIRKEQIRRLFDYLDNKSKFNGLGLVKEDFDLLTDLVTYEDRLPQGAPTSPMIANLICLGMDKDLKTLSTLDSLRVTRYCDRLDKISLLFILW